jgi:hypothetical protein
MPSLGMCCSHFLQQSAIAADSCFVSRNLSDALAEAHERIVQGSKDDLSPYIPPPFPVAEQERCTLFDWMALTD